MAEWPKADAYLNARGIRIGPPRLNQTSGGTHAGGSEHYEARARDYGDVDSDCVAVVNAMLPFAQGDNHQVDELFFTPTGTFYKDGRQIVASSDLRKQHTDHVHVGLIFNAVLSGDSVATPTLSPVSANADSGIAGFFTTITSHKTVSTIVKVLVGLVLTIVGIAMALQ